MSISGISNASGNAAKYNYVTSKKASNYEKDNEFNTTSQSNESDESSESTFTNILNSLFGKGTTGNISSYGSYTKKSFDEDTQNVFENFMKGMSFNKVYTDVRYQKIYKEAREFQELLKDLLKKAQNGDKGAKLALDLISDWLKDIKKETNDPEQILGKLMTKINDYMNSFTPDNFNPEDLKPGQKPNFATEIQKASVRVLSASLSMTALKNGDERVDGIESGSKKYVRFETKEDEQRLSDTLMDKVKQKKKHEPLKTTKKYVKNKAREEKIDDKIQEIIKPRFGVDDVSVNKEISQLVNDISQMDVEDADNDTVHITDFERLNRNLYSPAFV